MLENEFLSLYILMKGPSFKDQGMRERLDILQTPKQEVILTSRGKGL